MLNDEIYSKIKMNRLLLGDFAVFGYIKIYKGDLLVREYEAYKSVYCGLCRQMGKEYSFLSRFLLSYDCTFYALFLMSLKRSCKGFEKGRCRFNPLKGCGFCKCEDDALSKASAVNIILSYYKILDDIDDGGFFKRVLLKTVKPLLSHWRKKAMKRYPAFDRLAENMLNSQRKAEQNPECGLDMAADPTAEFLASVLEIEGSGKESRIYRQIGYGLGRFIYLADAVDDFNKDSKSGNFNPFNMYEENRLDVMKNNLSQSLAMTFEAYNLLDLVDFKGIIDNVILKGLPAVQSEIIKKFEVEYERPV